MPAPSITLDESACLDALRTFILAAVPEVAAVNVYRARPPSVPGKWGLSVVLNPTTPLPVFSSPMGEETKTAQRQRVRVTVKTPAAGAWSLRVFGVECSFAAPADATIVAIRDGLSMAVFDAALPVETLDGPPAGVFEVRADVAGASMGARLTVPMGGAGGLQMIDDDQRAATYNWGAWTIRAIIRDVGSAGQTGETSKAGAYAEMLRLRMQAQSVPVTAGLAYPYQRDLLAAANLCWRRTLGPFNADVVDNGVWHRGIALDFVFDVFSALTYDVPSLDMLVVDGPLLDT